MGGTATTAVHCSSPPDSDTLLKATDDRFHGVIVDTGALPSDPSAFGRALGASLEEWGGRGKRGVWLKIAREKANLISVAVEHGFSFHHAEPDFLMLTYWLPEEIPNHLPPNASHQVGVGAFVVNESGQILLVQEKLGPLKGTGLWKIPTGLVEQGEDLADAAVRECLEETGVEAVFETIVGFRHAHGAAFGKSDLFFVCVLRAKLGSSQFKLQDTEIEDAKWGSFDDFLQQTPYPSNSPVWHKLYGLCSPAVEPGLQVAGLTMDKLSIGSRPGTNVVYGARTGPTHPEAVTSKL